jgi:heme-degrading monooxygenase HmoA
MWEATVVEGRTDEAEEFVRSRVSELADDDGCVGAEGYVSYAATSEDTTDRLVLLSRWSEQSDAHDYDERPPFGRMFSRTHAWVFQAL